MPNTALTTLLAAALIAQASAAAYAPFAQPAFYALAPGAPGSTSPGAHAGGVAALDGVDGASHLFRHICARAGYYKPGSNKFNAACLGAGYAVPSRAHSERYCKTHGYDKAPPPRPRCSKTGRCGCRRRWCWQACGTDADAGGSAKGMDWCWSSYARGRDNWLRCRDDDDCSVLATTCGSKCG